MDVPFVVVLVLLSPDDAAAAAAVIVDDVSFDVALPSVAAAVVSAGNDSGTVCNVVRIVVDIIFNSFVISTKILFA